ncbi:MAG TPA: sulfatase [Pirellulaceae bacterium]|nr:sulfatase [Pirellulaceae bacterium]
MTVIARYGLATLVASLLGGVLQAAERPPNVVLIIADDQAWTDYGFMNHPVIQTPNIDRLARQGVCFARGYVPASLCRASLMSIITGQYPHQHLVTGNDPPRGTDRQLMLEHVRRTATLPKLLGDKGYVSFQSGKWWEGGFREGGFTAGMTHGDVTRGGRHGDDGLKIGRQGLKPIFDFIESRGDKPFFLWYAPMLPHQPHNPPQRLLDKYVAKTESLHVAKYWAMCEWFDETCGELLDYLDKQALAENTLVAYVADNGWIQDPAADKFAPRSKRSPNEGGIRTPIILRWPQRITPHRDDQTLVSSLDLAPTILAATAREQTKDMTGINLLEVAAGKKPSRDTLVGEIFEHDVANLADPTSGLLFRWCIKDRWKLIQAADRSQQELYDLAADPHDEHDVAAQHPDIVSDLAAKTDALWRHRQSAPRRP